MGGKKIINGKPYPDFKSFEKEEIEFLVKNYGAKRANNGEPGCFSGGKRHHCWLHNDIGIALEEYSENRIIKDEYFWYKQYPYLFKMNGLIKTLEKRFRPGMTWDNYGKWQVDLVVPGEKCFYPSPKSKWFRELWSLKNIQPLWWYENKDKSDYIPEEIDYHIFFKTGNFTTRLRGHYITNEEDFNQCLLMNLKSLNSKREEHLKNLLSEKQNTEAKKSYIDFLCDIYLPTATEEEKRYQHLRIKTEHLQEEIIGDFLDKTLEIWAWVQSKAKELKDAIEFINYTDSEKVDRQNAEAQVEFILKQLEKKDEEFRWPDGMELLKKVLDNTTEEFPLKYSKRPWKENEDEDEDNIFWLEKKHSR